MDKLKLYKSMLLPVGWSNAEGAHAMLLKVTKRENESYDLTLYNTGAGCQYHKNDPYDRKLKMLPYVEFSRVEKSKLLQPGFAQSLIEHQYSQCLPHSEADYSARDLYEGILKQFEGYRVLLPSKEKSDFITGQRSGTCSLRCFLAAFRDMVGKERYKDGNCC